jgi:xylose isomerase
LPKQKQTGVKLLWGTANLFSHRRFMAGAATNPDPDVFAYAAATVKKCIDVTKKLGARTTCCGAAAKAMRRCSTPT